MVGDINKADMIKTLESLAALATASSDEDIYMSASVLLTLCAALRTKNMRPLLGVVHNFASDLYDLIEKAKK